jgi:hypothetical protein
LIQPGGAEGHRINAIRGKPSGVGSPGSEKGARQRGADQKEIVEGVGDQGPTERRGT